MFRAISSASLPACSTVFRRTLAKKASKAAAATPAAPVALPAHLTHIVNGLNILKDGSDTPIKPDNEYPDWVWTLYVAAHYPT